MKRVYIDQPECKIYLHRYFHIVKGPQNFLLNSVLEKESYLELQMSQSSIVERGQGRSKKLVIYIDCLVFKVAESNFDTHLQIGVALTTQLINTTIHYALN